MTKHYNALIAEIAAKAALLADMTMAQLRMEHPDAAETEIPTQGHADRVLKGYSRGKLIEDILIDDFSEEFDFEIDGLGEQTPSPQ